MSNFDRYVLDENGNAVPEPDLMKWGIFFKRSSNRVLQQDSKDSVKVSTVFLGLDHSFGDGPPLLWETMIFGGEHDQYQERYTTRDEALKGHRLAMEMAGLAAKGRTA
jgi:hypothetical protein